MNILLQPASESNEIVSLMQIAKKKVPATTSLIIAESFGKEHKNIIRDIENLINTGKFTQLNFEPIFYKDSYGRKQKMYALDETLATVLIMGFTGDDVLDWKIRYALRFQELRSSLDIRSHEEKIISLYISRDPNPWVKTFPPDFYRHLCRFYNVKFNAEKPNLPAYFGHLTNNVVYERLAPYVADYLKKNTPRLPSGRLKHKYHQNFSNDYGCKELKEHLIGVMALMKSAFSWDEFQLRLNDVFPRYGRNIEGISLF